VIFEIEFRIYYMCILEIFGWCPGDFGMVSWRYLIGVSELFVGCPGDI